MLFVTRSPGGSRCPNRAGADLFFVISLSGPSARSLHFASRSALCLMQSGPGPALVPVLQRTDQWLPGLERRCFHGSEWHGSGLADVLMANPCCAPLPLSAPPQRG